MISEHQQEQASLYALGALAAEEQRAFEAELLANAELRALAQGMQSALSVAVCAMPAAPLPSDLKGKVMERIAAVEAAGRSTALPPGLSFLIAADQTGWKPLSVPGTSIKLLSFERDHRYAVLLGKLEPGARYPAHVNAGPEDFYILSGDLVIGDRKLVAGDFHHADRGSQHEENYSEKGCTLLAVLTTDDPLVAFAMS
jgi:anti-sigma factor ChrR (cupin superfamily)